MSVGSGADSYFPLIFLRGSLRYEVFNDMISLQKIDED